MMVIPHIQLNGTLAVCANPEACALEFHLPELTLEEMQGYPAPMLRDLLAQLQAPKSKNHPSADFQFWYDERNNIHRDYDMPAVIFDNGHDYAENWYRHGKQHRDGGLPAEVWRNGRQEWWVRGKLHRDGDLPALITMYNREWYRHGRLHRAGRLPAVEERIVSIKAEYWKWGVKLPNWLARIGVKFGWLLPMGPWSS